MIIEKAQRTAGANGIAIEVGKHLLASLQADIKEEHHGDGLMSQFRALFECFDYGSPAMLTVVDYEVCIHGNPQQAELVLPGNRLECYL